MNPIRVYYANNACYIDSVDYPIVAGTLTATLLADQVQVTADSRTYPLASIPWAAVADFDGNTFPTPDAVMAYLAAQFAMRRPVGETFGVAIVAGAELAQGIPLAISRGNGQLLPARADTYTLAFVAGLASTLTAQGFAVLPAHGAVTLSDWTTATGAAFLSHGVPYFLGATGGLTAAPPVQPGQCVTRVGFASSATTLIVAPSDPITL